MNSFWTVSDILTTPGDERFLIYSTLSGILHVIGKLALKREKLFLDLKKSEENHRNN
jgi:hypothetical protein